jgi:O-antigen biosynthesis protein
MTPSPQFSPLHTDYGVKYQDRPRNDVIEMLTFPFRNVLEIGCGAGATGKEIKRLHPAATYYGIEIDEAAAVEARAALDCVITGNVERMNLEHAGIRKQMFDVVICADVLEHLYDPWSLVSSLHDYLVPGGRIVASIPNIQNIRVVRNLIGGRWTYTNQGLLDATHIRFFTLREIGEMFVKNNYFVEEIISSVDADMPADGPWPRSLDLGTMVFRDLTLEHLQQLYTFQYLVRVRSTAGTGGAQ